jgi:alpha-D-ribose 1-methylphosphonate 5-triphosphate diphosphatase
MDLEIVGGRVLLPQRGFVAEHLSVQDGRIGGIGSPGPGRRIDAGGLLVLPGIIDIHGDAFERQVQPRPGIAFPYDLAVADTEAQLLANGITTAYLGVTLSWEPGLRSLEAWEALLAALDGARSRLACDMRVHLRWEAFNLPALDQAVADIAAGRVHLLAFNDHTPGILRKLDDPVAGAKFAARAGMDMPEFRALAERIAGGAAGIDAARARLVTAAHAARLPMASHDDESPDIRAAFRALGATICEFPTNAATARAARAAGDTVVMGAPNVVRGGSHMGWASAAEMAESGLCDVLSSDYFYPALLRAAFVLADRGTLDLAQAWALISEGPARAAGLYDRGRIEPDARADLVLVDPRTRAAIMTIAGGRIAWLGAVGAARVG